MWLCLFHTAQIKGLNPTCLFEMYLNKCCCHVCSCFVFHVFFLSKCFPLGSGRVHTIKQGTQVITAHCQIKGLLIQMRSEISKKSVPFAASHLSTQETAARRLPQGHSQRLWQQTALDSLVNIRPHNILHTSRRRVKLCTVHLPGHARC